MQTRNNAKRSPGCRIADWMASWLALQLFTREKIRPMPAHVEFVKRFHHPYLKAGCLRNACAQDLVAHVGPVAPERFAPSTRSGDGIAIDAEIAQQLVGIGEAAIGQRHIDHQLSVPGCPAGHVEPSGLEKCVAPEERSLLPEETGLISEAAKI